MKKKFFVAACAATMVMGCAMTANAAEVDLSDGLIGEYLFDGDFTDTVSGNEAVAYDAYDGYWAGTVDDPKPALAVDTARGNVVEMKGTWNTTGYLSLDTGCLDEIEDSFSVAMWAKANNSKTGDNGVCGSDSGLFNFYMSDTEKTKTRFCGLDVSLTPWINDGAGDWVDRTAKGVQLSTSDWQFVVMTMDFSAGQIKVYVDGVNTATVDALGGGTYESLLTQIKAAKQIQIGTLYPWWDVWDFRGYTDDIRMYNKVLTQNEITALMNYESDKTVDVPSVYVQYKQVEDNYTVRVVAEVGIADLDSYAGAGFRCTKTAQATATAEAQLSTVVFKSIRANDASVTAADGKYFVVTEITDVPADGTLYVRPAYQLLTSGSTVTDFADHEYTISMADIIK